MPNETNAPGPLDERRIAAAVRAVYDQLQAAGRYASATEVRDLNPAAFQPPPPKLVRAEVVDPWMPEYSMRVCEATRSPDGLAVEMMHGKEPFGTAFNRARLAAGLAMLSHPKLTPDGLWPEGTVLQLDPPPDESTGSSKRWTEWFAQVRRKFKLPTEERSPEGVCCYDEKKAAFWQGYAMAVNDAERFAATLPQAPDAGESVEGMVLKIYALGPEYRVVAVPKDWEPGTRVRITPLQEARNG